MLETKRKRSGLRSWADLHSDIFDLVLQKLPFADRFRSKGVCKTWRSNAENHILSLLETIHVQSPLLTLPNDEITKHSDGLCVANILENKRVVKNNNLPRKFDQGFIGSSKGWLVFEDENQNIYLFNPFLDVGIRTNLPRLEISKVVILSNPIVNHDNIYGLVVLYGDSVFQNDIAYATSGDENWSYFTNDESYCDIVSTHHLVYALRETDSVEVWNLKTTVAMKIMTIRPSFSSESQVEYFPPNLYYRESYLVVSKDELFMVRRQIGNHVRDDGLVVSEADDDDEVHVCSTFRYMTKYFHIFKLDFIKIEWTKVEELGDRVAFLGGNESVLAHSCDFKGYEKNSIYFTDDNWDDLNINKDSGGHDTGIYRLKDHSVEWLFDSPRIRPYPFWVIPYRN